MHGEVTSAPVKRRISQLGFTQIHHSVSAGVAAPVSVGLSLSVLLGVVGLLSFGILGLLGGVAIGLFVGRFGGPLFGSSTPAPDLVECEVCGVETLSSTRRCPSHR